MQKKQKILVAVSGGVDSAVSAAILVRQGFDVSGAYMINYDDKSECWRNEYRDALRVCAKINIPLLKLDFCSQYEKEVLNRMFKSYRQYKTPNPDILCNKYIKFSAWQKKALDLGFDKLATGHYACVKKIKNEYQLRIPKDKIKDQTYFLCQLNQKQLKNAIFPLCGYTKKQVRAIARQYELPNADKKESMGICFVGKVDMRSFLQKKIKSKVGRIKMSKTGEVIGEHQGLPFYTIGQRHIGSSLLKKNNSEPLYIIKKDKIKNEIIVGFGSDKLLFKKSANLININWISGEVPSMPMHCKCRLRHGQDLQATTVDDENGKFTANFEIPQSSVACGQYIVFYKNGVCIGGAEMTY
ncbi:MAG: tRNA 2-thiouridine(34) synthase MnmA [bacterium]